MVFRASSEHVLIYGINTRSMLSVMHHVVVICHVCHMFISYTRDLRGRARDRRLETNNRGVQRGA